MRYRGWIIITLILAALSYAYSAIPYSQNTTTPPTTKVGEESIPGLTTREGFVVSYFAEDVSGARSMARNSDGSIVYVGTRDSTLYAVIDSDLDGVSDRTVTIRSDLKTPNGVAYQGGDLYVAEVSRILKFSNIDTNYDKTPAFEVIYDQLPTETHHGWKYIAFGPDGLLYIPIGAPCNVCEDQGRFARILTLNVETKEAKTYATGIRNTVGFDWSPHDQSLWFTDNGRDLLGDDTPKDELNHAPNPGLNFGYPYCHGNSVVDPTYGDAESCEVQTKPAIELGPHVAALGVKFYRGTMFPEEYKDRVIIAEHGSWNRRDPIGYRLTTVDIEGDVASNYQDFVTGWLVEGESWGRPVDLLELPDGSLLVSDDLNNAIYRLTYSQ